MKKRSSIKPPLLVLAILFGLTLAALLSLLIYIRCNSYFINSEDGSWRVGAYQPEPFRELWAGRLFYFGEDSISSLKVACKVKNKEEAYYYEPVPDMETPGFYTKLLAGQSITNTYCFHDLNYGNPQFEEITITWVDSRGDLQKYLFHFK